MSVRVRPRPQEVYKLRGFAEAERLYRSLQLGGAGAAAVFEVVLGAVALGRLVSEHLGGLRGGSCEGKSEECRGHTVGGAKSSGAGRGWEPRESGRRGGVSGRALALTKLVIRPRQSGQDRVYRLETSLTTQSKQKLLCLQGMTTPIGSTGPVRQMQQSSSGPPPAPPPAAGARAGPEACAEAGGGRGSSAEAAGTVPPSSFTSGFTAACILWSCAAE